MQTKTILVLIATMAATLTACEPCIADINGVIIDACRHPDAEDTGDQGSSGGMSETGADPTGGGLCGDAPLPGAVGGPCNDETPCAPVDGVQPVCQMMPNGSVCSLPCPFVGTCSELVCGASDVCVPGSVCQFECDAAADCPHAGMVCDPAGMCLWPI